MSESTPKTPRVTAAVALGALEEHLKGLEERLGARFDALEKRLVALEERPADVPPTSTIGWDTAAVRRDVTSLTETVRRYQRDILVLLLAHGMDANVVFEESAEDAVASTFEELFEKCEQLLRDRPRSGHWNRVVRTFDAACRAASNRTDLDTLVTLGQSVERAYRALLEKQRPGKLDVVASLARSLEGVSRRVQS